MARDHFKSCLIVWKVSQIGVKSSSEILFLFFIFFRSSENFDIHCAADTTVVKLGCGNCGLKA